jgi:DNA-binding transcriptional ArsR family regulator
MFNIIEYGNKPRSPALAALAQETRLAIFRLLVEAGPTGLAAGEIAATVGVAPTNLSFHLKELAHAASSIRGRTGATSSIPPTTRT